MTKQILISILSLELISLFLLEKITNPDLQWIISLSIQYFVYFLVCTCTFNLISYKELANKILALLVVLMSGWWFFDHIIQSFLQDESSQDLFRVISASGFLLFFCPLFLHILYRNKLEYSDTYDATKCFIVYTKPNNWFSTFIAAFRHDMKSSCFMVIKGVRYYYGGKTFFSKGVLKKRKHVNIKGLCYKEIDEHNIDCLLGKKWKIWLTCFKTFEKYNKK